MCSFSALALQLGHGELAEDEIATWLEERTIAEEDESQKQRL